QRTSRTHHQLPVSLFIHTHTHTHTQMHVKYLNEAQYTQTHLDKCFCTILARCRLPCATQPYSECRWLSALGWLQGRQRRSPNTHCSGLKTEAFTEHTLQWS